MRKILLKRKVLLMISGVASSLATERFRQRFASLHPTHFRQLQDLWVSSIGLGTYLGDADDDTDARYRKAITEAIARGCNVIDTAINYRCQRSERLIGRTLGKLIAGGAITRDEIVLCTKGGYLPFDGAVPEDPARYIADTFINQGLAAYDDLVGGCHCLAPAYLDASLHTSLRNLQVDTIDVYYLHNPEQQREEIGHEAFCQRLTAAFELLERRAREGAIRYYGIATWQGLRSNPKSKSYLSLEEAVGMAQRIGGATHHCRVVQLPYNLAMPEAYSFANQTVRGKLMTPLAAAQALGLTAVASASLLQQQLTTLPASLARRIPNLSTSAQRALQFVRSTPGLTTALVGMKQMAHVEDNLALAQQPLLTPEQLSGIFDRSHRASHAR